MRCLVFLCVTRLSVLTGAQCLCYIRAVFFCDFINNNHNPVFILIIMKNVMKDKCYPWFTIEMSNICVLVCEYQNLKDFFFTLE